MHIEQLQAVQARHEQAGGRRLGSLLWWSLSSNRISHPELEAMFEQNGLTRDYLPKAVKPAGAFRRAWRHAASGLASGLMLRRISESADELVVGLVEEHPDPTNKDLDYRVLSRISFDKAEGRIEADAEHSVVEEVRRLYRRHLDHSTDDIRAMLTAFLADAGISLRESGGVYFVPARFSTTLDAVCAVVEAAGGNTTFRLPVLDTPDGRSTLRDVANRSLDDEIRALEQELAGFDPDSVRVSTLERRVEAFDALRSRVQLFSGVLSFKAEAMLDRIAHLQAGLRGQLGAKGAAVPTPIPTPHATVTPYSEAAGF